MRRLLRWMTPLCFMLAVGALIARPAAASAAGCTNDLICARCVCGFNGVCECTLCLPECLLILF